MAECAGLENRCAARYRGFESLPLRLDSSALNESRNDAISCSGNGLRLVASGEPEVADGAAVCNQSQSESAVRAKKCDKNEPIKLATLPPTLDELRQTVQDCEELPEYIRSAILALISNET